MIPARTTVNNNLIYSSEFFPASEAAPPPKPGLLGVIQTDPQTRREVHGAIEARGHGRNTGEIPTLRREDAFVDDAPEIEGGDRRSPTRKRKRTISERELKNISGNDGESMQLLDGSKKRLRKPPRRFGRDE